MRRLLPAFEKLTSLTVTVQNSQFDSLRAVVSGCENVGSQIRTLSVRGTRKGSPEGSATVDVSHLAAMFPELTSLSLSHVTLLQGLFLSHLSLYKCKFFKPIFQFMVFVPFGHN